MDISSLRALVAFLVHFANSVNVAMADKRFDLSDVVLFLNLLRDLPEALAGIQGAIPEWRDLSDLEKNILYAEIEKLDLEDRNIEKMAEGIVKAIVMAGPLVNTWLKKAV